MYALFKDGKQVSKAHESKRVVVMEAYDLKAVIHCHADFPGDVASTVLADGYEIREVV